MPMTTKSGNWSDPSVWGGAIPGAGQMAHIAAGHNVVYDVESETVIGDLMVEIGAKLTWRTTGPTRLRVNTIMAMGIVSIQDTAEHSTPGAARHEIIFHPNATAPGTSSRLGAEFMGPTRIHGGPKKGHLRSSGLSIAAGATTVTLPGLAASGWRVGDTLIILGTNYVAPGADPQYTGPTSYFYTKMDGTSKTVTLNDGIMIGQDEERTITAISGDTVTLSSALTYAHAGMTGTLKDGQVITVKPVVANVTRSIRFRTSETANLADPQQRAHLMFMRQPDVDLRYFESKNLGRTATDPSLVVPDDRKLYVSNGGALRSDPNNVRGRYAIHLHWCGGPYVDAPLVPLIGATAWSPVGTTPLPGWGIVQHGTRAAIEDCVVSNVRGAGMVSELGNETGQWANNVVTGCRGDGDSITWGSRSEEITNHNGSAGIAYENQSRAVLLHGNIAGSSKVAFFNQPQKTNKVQRAPRDVDMRFIDGLASGSGGTGNRAYDPATYSHAQAQFPPFLDNEAHACRSGLHIVHRMNQGPLAHHGADQMPMLLERFHCLNTATPFQVNEYSNTYYFKDCLWQGTGGGVAASLGNVSWDWNFSNMHIRNFGTAFNDSGAGLNYDGFFIDITTENVGQFTNAPTYTATNLSTHAAKNVMGNWEDVSTNSARIRRYVNLDSATDLPQPYPLAPYGRKLPSGHPPVNPGDTPYFVLGDGTNGAASTSPVAIALTLTAGNGRDQGRIYGIIRDSVGDRRYPDWQSSESFPQNIYAKSHRTLAKLTPEMLVQRWGCWNDNGTWKCRVWFLHADRFTHKRFAFHIDYTLSGFASDFLAANSLGTTGPAAPEWPDKLEAVPATQRPLTAITRTLSFLSRTRLEAVQGGALLHKLRPSEVTARAEIVGGVNAGLFAIDGQQRLTWAGTPPAVGSYAVTVRVTDNWGNTTDTPHTVVVVSSSRVSSSISDTFDRANSNLLPYSNYTALAGANDAFRIVNNRLESFSAATVDLGSLGTSEQEVSAIFRASSNNMVLLRMVDANNWLGFRFLGSAAQLWMCVAGAQTSLASFQNPGTIPFSVRVQGNKAVGMWLGNSGNEPVAYWPKPGSAVPILDFDPRAEPGAFVLPSNAPLGTNVGLVSYGATTSWLDNFTATALPG